MRSRNLVVIALTVAALGCADDDADETVRTQPAENAATALASGRAELSPDELEAGRLDRSWRPFADRDASERRAARAGRTPGQAPGQAEDAAGAGETPADDPGAAADTATEGSAADDPSAGNGETWEDISAEAVNRPVSSFPIAGDAEGPAVARLQILLDNARFSPGIIDGRWGKNTEKAVYWFQNENGMEPTGEADEATMRRLEQAAGLSQPVRTHTLTEQDVEGPFVQLPEDIYDRAEQSCLCYESLREKLGEVFHASPELLEQLNPDLDLASISAGDRLAVPAVETFHVGQLPEGRSQEGEGVARVVISDGGHYLHALNEQGDILYHFPSTLGSDYAPSPSGEFTVRSITFDPTWHYQPEILTGVDPSRDDAVLPPGPNNAVGIVWMQLSRDHYGIHGTAAPETIGYVTSNGCVRLTNWDAAVLGRTMPAGTPVEFRDVD